MTVLGLASGHPNALHSLRVELRDRNVFNEDAMRILRDFRSGLPQLNVTTGNSHQRNLFVGAGVVWYF